MKHYGDICKLKGEELPEVDIITGGSPCQDLSIAGKRAGLDGERSGLFMEQIRVIKEMRAEYARKHGIKADDVRRIKPRFMVWENVPGAFSSNNGEDFRAVLEETARIVDPDASIPGLEDGESWRNSGFILGDEWAIAWRVHDAQFWGVPQRRRRISLVADFGGQTAPEILFERESVPGDIKQGGKEGQGIAADLAGGNNSASKEKLIVDNHQQAARFKISQDDICPSISAKQGTGGNNGPMVLETISFQERGGKPGGGKGILTQEEKTGALSTLNNQAVVYRKTAHPMNKDDGQGWEPADVSDTLNVFDNSESRTPTVVIEGNGSRPSHNGPGFEESDVSYTLNTIERHGVAYSQDAYDKYSESDVSATIKQSGGVYGGGERNSVCSDVTGPICSRDYKGVGDQYVRENKLVINYEKEDKA